MPTFKDVFKEIDPGTWLETWEKGHAIGRAYDYSMLTISCLSDLRWNILFYLIYLDH